MTVNGINLTMQASANGLVKRLPVVSAQNTITGVGFGVKDNTTLYYDDFENQPLSSVSGSINSLHISNSSGVTISDLAYSGAKCIAHDYSQNPFPKIYYTLSGTKSYCYYSCHLKFTGAQNDSTGVWKLGRIGAGAEYSGVPHVGESYTATAFANVPEAFGGESVTSEGITDYSATLDVNNPSLYVNGQWMFYELEFYTGTIDNNDGFFRIKLDGQVVIEWSALNSFLTTANSSLPTWLLTVINGLSGVHPVMFYQDNVYIDECLNRVVMTNNSNYTASTKFAIQPIISWSDTSISYTRKRQGFAINDTAYLHVIDSNNNLVYSSSAITITED